MKGITIRIYSKTVDIILKQCEYILKQVEYILPRQFKKIISTTATLAATITIIFVGSPYIYVCLYIQ